jgi:hypothetical protein
MRNFSLHANKCAQSTDNRSSQRQWNNSRFSGIQTYLLRTPLSTVSPLRGEDTKRNLKHVKDGTLTASTFSKCLPALMTIEDVLKALDRYMRESNESDRRTAAMLGIKRATLRAWLQGTDSPQKCILARLAGFLRRVGYL